MGGDFKPAASDVLAEGLPNPCGEQPVKVEGREMRDTSERLEVKRFNEVPIDVLDNPVHPRRVLGAAIYVETSNFSGFHSIPSVVGPAM